MEKTVRNNYVKMLKTYYSKDASSKKFDAVKIEANVYSQATSIYNTLYTEKKKMSTEEIDNAYLLLTGNHLPHTDFDYEDIPLEDIYKRLLYEKIGEKNDESVSKIGWTSPYYDNFKEAQKIKNAILTKEAPMSEGTYKCKNIECNSMNCYIIPLQIRSADEGMTIFTVCKKCGQMKRREG